MHAVPIVLSFEESSLVDFVYVMAYFLSNWILCTVEKCLHLSRLKSSVGLAWTVGLLLVIHPLHYVVYIKYFSGIQNP